MKRQLKVAISGIFYLLTWPFSVLAAAVGLRVRPNLVILYYHDIPPASREQFAHQMDKLTRRATVVGPDWRGGPIKGRVCAVTFDDAFVSVVDNALPELEKRQLPCTIFVPVGALGAAPAWTMETNYAPDEVVADQEQLKSLTSPLVTLGGHTLTHPFLSRLPREAARVELEESRTRLSALTGYDVRTMSFPYGDYDQEVLTMCRAAGYDLVYGIVPTKVDPEDGAFLRGRVAVNPDDSDLEFFLKMSGCYRWMSLASTVKHAVLSPLTILKGRKSTPRKPVSPASPNRWSGSL